MDNLVNKIGFGILIDILQDLSLVNAFIFINFRGVQKSLQHNKQKVDTK